MNEEEEKSDIPYGEDKEPLTFLFGVKQEMFGVFLESDDGLCFCLQVIFPARPFLK